MAVRNKDQLREPSFAGFQAYPGVVGGGVKGKSPTQFVQKSIPLSASVQTNAWYPRKAVLSPPPFIWAISPRMSSLP